MMISGETARYEPKSPESVLFAKTLNINIGTERDKTE